MVRKSVRVAKDLALLRIQEYYEDLNKKPMNKNEVEELIKNKKVSEKAMEVILKGIMEHNETLKESDVSESVTFLYDDDKLSDKGTLNVMLTSLPNNSMRNIENDNNNNDNIDDIDYLSVQHAIPLLTSFDGTNPKEIFEFIEKAESALKVVDPGQKTIFFTAIKAKLCKDAAQVVRHQNPNNWSDLKKFLLEYYTNKKSLNKRIVDLSLLKQGISMSVRDFANKIQLQYEGIKQIIEFEHRNIGDGLYLIDDIVLKTFLDGLIYEISIVVRAQQPRDFNQALEIAMKTEMDHCKTSTHFTKDCRILANQSVQLFKNNLSFNNHRRENNYNSNRGSNNRFGANQNYRGSYNFNINRNNNFGRNGGFKNQTKVSIVTLFLDTGSDISLIKLNAVKNRDTINIQSTKMLLGITNNPIQTLGEIKLEFLINNKVLMFPFQIVPDNFPIESEGIAGSNFLKKFQAIINYESNKLVLNNTVFQLYIYRINANREKIYIPPRCEMVVPVGVTNNIAEGILEGYELIPGVYYPSCILKVINNISYTTILNTTENEISVKNLVVSLSPINEGENVKINAINSKCINRDGDNRIKNILNSLRLSHLNNEEKENILLYFTLRVMT